MPFVNSKQSFTYTQTDPRWMVMLNINSVNLHCSENLSRGCEYTHPQVKPPLLPTQWIKMAIRLFLQYIRKINICWFFCEGRWFKVNQTILIGFMAILTFVTERVWEIWLRAAKTSQTFSFYATLAPQGDVWTSVLPLCQYSTNAKL